MPRLSDDAPVGGGVGIGGGDGARDSKFSQAVEVVIAAGKASTSLLCRRLSVGYGRAAKIIDQMEEAGIVGPPNGSKPREVLVSSIDDIADAD